MSHEKHSRNKEHSTTHNINKPIHFANQFRQWVRFELVVYFVTYLLSWGFAFGVCCLLIHKEMRTVVSLFNGMGTLRQALSNLNIKVDKYYSSEIKPYANELQQYHFPDVIQVGNITKWKEWNIDWAKVDFIGSGSPCQEVSIAGNRKGLEGDRSSLFFVFVQILEHAKKFNPNVLFLQENVGSAPRKDVGIMSRALGVYPARINSKLVTAQLRDRYYWTNIRTKPDGIFGDVVSDIPQPKDRKIIFKDIIENGVTDREKSGTLMECHNKLFGNVQSKESATLERQLKKGHQIPPIVYIENNEVRVKTNTVKGYDLFTENDCLNLSFPTSTTRRGRVTKGKSPCLLKGNEPLYTLDNYTIRTLTQTELERLQGFEDGYTSILTRNKAASLLGDGWTLPVIEHILTFIKR